MAKNSGPKLATSASRLRKILVCLCAVSALGHGAEAKTKIDELDSHRGKHDYVVMFSDSLEEIEKVLERCAKLEMEDKGHAAGTQQNSTAAPNEELSLCQARADSLEQERQQLEKELLNRLIDLKADSLERERTIAELQKQNADLKDQNDLQSRELKEQASRCSAQAAEAASIKAYSQQAKLEAEEDLENLKADLLEKEWTIAELQKQNADLKNLVEQIIDSSKTAEKDGSSQNPKTNLKELGGKALRFASEHKEEIAEGAALSVVAAKTLRSDNRYGIKEEFALVYNCIFAGRGNMTQTEFQELADCCAEALKEIEDKYSSVETFQNSGAPIGKKCRR